MRLSVFLTVMVLISSLAQANCNVVLRQNPEGQQILLDATAALAAKGFATKLASRPSATDVDYVLRDLEPGDYGIVVVPYTKFFGGFQMDIQFVKRDERGLSLVAETSGVSYSLIGGNRFINAVLDAISKLPDCTH